MLGCFTHHGDSMQSQMLAEHTLKEGVLRDFDGVKVKRVNAKETLQCLLQTYGGNNEVLKQYPISYKVADVCRSMQTTGSSHAGFTLALAEKLCQVWRYDCGGEGDFQSKEKRYQDAHNLAMQLTTDISAISSQTVFKCLLDLMNMPVWRVGILAAYVTAKRQREAFSSNKVTNYAARRKPYQRATGRGNTRVCYRFYDSGACDRIPCRWQHACKNCGATTHGAVTCSQTQ